MHGAGSRGLQLRLWRGRRISGAGMRGVLNCTPGRMRRGQGRAPYYNVAWRGLVVGMGFVLWLALCRYYTLKRGTSQIRATSNIWRGNLVAVI